MDKGRERGLTCLALPAFLTMGTRTFLGRTWCRVFINNIRLFATPTHLLARSYIMKTLSWQFIDISNSPSGCLLLIIISGLCVALPSSSFSAERKGKRSQLPCHLARSFAKLSIKVVRREKRNERISNLIWACLLFLINVKYANLPSEKRSENAGVNKLKMFCLATGFRKYPSC